MEGAWKHLKIKLIFKALAKITCKSPLHQHGPLCRPYNKRAVTVLQWYTLQVYVVDGE